MYGEPDAVPYDAPGTGGGGGEAWSFLGMGANAWFVIIAGLIIWALIASARARHRAELARHEGLRTRYQDQAPPESNLGGGGDYYDAGYDEPRSMYGDRGRAPGPGDDWEEL
ncbi:MAG: hypothetical protein KC933_32855 [Myxococcales bacterium]|nr:hypothetical protein [Myxococcales bacterium]